jgi:hypothetical protein
MQTGAVIKIIIPGSDNTYHSAVHHRKKKILKIQIGRERIPGKEF